MVNIGRKEFIVIFIGMIGIVVASGILLNSNVDDRATADMSISQQQADASVDELEAEAYAQAVIYMQENLDSPSSAQFPGFNDPSVTVSLTNGMYVVDGWVDEESSSGEVVRSTFSAAVQHRDNEWQGVGYVIGTISQSLDE